MNKITKILAAISFIVILVALWLFNSTGQLPFLAQENITTNQGYTLINDMPEYTGDNIEVTEYFWYGCQHCYQLHKFIPKWQQQLDNDVIFKHVPVGVKPEWIDHARFYFATEKLGLIPQLHHALFTEIHHNKQALDTMALLLDLVEKKAINRTQFKQTMNSTDVEQKILHANKKIKQLKLNQTPVIIINNRYKITRKTAKGYENMLKVSNQIIKQIKSKKIN